MGEHDELRDHYVDAIMKATTNEEKVRLGGVLNQYDANTNERKKNDQKLRLDQDIHEDDLRKSRDQALIDDRRYRWEVIKDSINIGIRVIGGIATFGLLAKYMKDDKNGEPWWGPMKDIGSALMRKWI